jgi:hypothetical protein
MANASNSSANRYKGNDIDTDGDGRVGKADHASNASNAQKVKGNDIDSDGNGQVDAADYADTAGDADTVDGQHASDLGGRWEELGRWSRDTYGTPTTLISLSNISYDRIRVEFQIDNDSSGTSANSAKVGLTVNGVTSGYGYYYLKNYSDSYDINTGNSDFTLSSGYESKHASVGDVEFAYTDTDGLKGRYNASNVSNSTDYHNTTCWCNHVSSSFSSIEVSASYSDTCSIKGEIVVYGR